MTLLFYLLTVSILAGAALFTVSKDSDKAFFGYRFYSVLTNSMVSPKGSPHKDGFSAGDIIIVQMINPKQLKVDDIITYNILTTDPKSNAVLTHRIIDIQEDVPNRAEGQYFITKGDANNGEDTPVSVDQVVGKVVYSIPKVGVILGYLRENFFVSLGVLVALFALIISLRYYFSYSPSGDPFEGPPSPSYARR
nr:signal peptidase I [Vagococcus allomyrinae]